MRFAAFWGSSVAALIAALPLPAEASASRGIGEIRVEEACIVAGTAKGSPKRISIVFSTTEELPAARLRLGLGYVAARLTDCENGDSGAMEVIDQGAEYLVDRGRVSSLGRTMGGGWRYRVLFDDSLAQTVDHRARFTPASTTPGGLCFSLYAARMWFGRAQTNSVPVDLGAADGIVRAK